MLYPCFPSPTEKSKHRLAIGENYNQYNTAKWSDEWDNRKDSIPQF